MYHALIVAAVAIFITSCGGSDTVTAQQALDDTQVSPADETITARQGLLEVHDAEIPEHIKSKFPESRYPYAVKENGCGSSKGMGDSAQILNGHNGIVNFQSACDEHDRCYSTLGTTFEVCNDNFYRDMVNACKKQLSKPIPNPTVQSMFEKVQPILGDPPGMETCKSVARTYYNSVQSGAYLGYFRKIQIEQKDYENQVADWFEAKK